MMAVGTFDVCTNAAVNSDLSCFLCIWATAAVKQQAID